jgi:hypothetical protein
MKETLWKNTFNFVKDVPIIHVNFIVIVIRVSEKKIGISFVLTFTLSILKLFFEHMANDDRTYTCSQQDNVTSKTENHFQHL